jgi:trk system potassium uptake protein TrkH
MEDFQLPRKKPDQLAACVPWIHPLLSLAAAACLLSIVGWSGEIGDWQHWGTVIAGIVFGLDRVGAYGRRGRYGRERVRLGVHAAAGVLVFLVSAMLWFRPLSATGEWSLGSHVFVQLAIIASGLSSMIHHQARFTRRAFHPGLLLIGSFLFIIITGTFLLKMPRCTVPGQTCTWLDALFTSTSAVCVTGLTVQNTATFFSHTGQIVILLLIQIGGLGIMTLTFFAAVMLFEGISLHDRLLLGRMMQENRLARVDETLKFIVCLTFICEAIGATVLFFTMDAVPHLGARLFHSVFHAVSAFCNAGFSTFPDGMASAVVNANASWQICILVLIVIGGLGSLACEDLTRWAVAKGKRRLGKEAPRIRLRIHTRLVLVVTAFLIAGGAIVMYLTEFVAHEGPANGGRILTAIFHSITARTAGFNTVPMGNIGILTIQALMILMIIGGSPGGTAGGLRTTVVAVGLGHLWSQLRSGCRGMVAFHRTIPRETGSRALGLMVLAVLWLGANFIALQALQTGSGVAGRALLFELISAFATVGLSLDLTPALTDGGRMLIILNMFVGRIGLLTVLATLIPPDHRPVSGKPEENILLT